jgi:hypothetical protein
MTDTINLLQELNALAHNYFGKDCLTFSLKELPLSLHAFKE